MSGKQEQNRQERREKLRVVAMQVFTEIGYDKATVSDIVRRAEMTPSTFYNYYRDKDSLRDELVAVAAANFLVVLDTARQGADSAAAYFGAAAAELFRVLVEEQSVRAFLSHNQGFLRETQDNPQLMPVWTRLRADADELARERGLDPADREYFVALLRGAALEIGIALLTSEAPDREAASSFFRRIVAAALPAR